MRAWLGKCFVMLALGGIVGCSNPSTPPSTTSGGPKPASPAAAVTAPSAAPVEAAMKWDEPFEKLVRACDKYGPDDDVMNSKEFKPVIAEAEARAEKKDKAFLETIFSQARLGQPKDKQAAIELMAIVPIPYRRGEWADRDYFEKMAVTGVTTSKDEGYRKACNYYLVYSYDAKSITPQLLAAYKGMDAELKLDMLQKFGDHHMSYIEKNEAALKEMCLPIAQDKAEKPEMRAAAIIILGYAGKGDAQVKKAVQDLSADSDPKIKKATEKALEKLGTVKT